MSYELFLGDIHADFNVIDKMLNRFRDVPGWKHLYQVGDFGLGFPPIVNVATGETFERKPKPLDPRVRFIRGNHDNPETCWHYVPNYMGDYGYDRESGIFFLSGAWSIDVNQRTPGIDWWHGEELPSSRLQDAIDLYLTVKPNVVLSHTCPASLARYFAQMGGYYGSRTEDALEMMLNGHRPKLWVFGHWHTMFDRELMGTRFVCCDINQPKLLEMPT